MIKVLLAEDHELVRNGIRMMLESSGGFLVVAEAADGREALQAVRTHAPDLAIVDIGMPNLNGIETTRQIRITSPTTRILILTMNTDPQYVREAFGAGANGYVLKGAAFKELLEAIQQVLAGKTYLSQGLPAFSADDLRRGAGQRPSSALASLTAREREVLQLIAEGNSGTEIARDLGVSARTVESHRERIMAKLDLHSIADLTRFAIRKGVCSSEQ
jgi:DNA-binding NarL/FixJ family response regulator